MEAVIDVAAGLTEERDSKVKNIVLEGRVLNEEIYIQNLKLRPCEEITEHICGFDVLKLSGKRSFKH
jgi:predicted RNA-binding protein